MSGNAGWTFEESDFTMTEIWLLIYAHEDLKNSKVTMARLCWVA